MGYYFDERESAAYLYGTDPRQIIPLMAARYMGANPRSPFVWRLFRETGISCDRQARYHFPFDQLFPTGEIGEFALAMGDLYCPEAKRSAFLVTCRSPMVLWLNGTQVFCSNVAQERSEAPCRIEVQLNQGYNRFLLQSERTAIGFGCTLQNAMPQWEPCNYLMPFMQRQGEAGFLYTARLRTPVMPTDSLWAEDELATGLVWYPREKEPLEEAGNFYAWGMLENASLKMVAHHDLQLWLDGRLAPAEVPAGRHELLAFGPLHAIATLEKELQHFWKAPVNIKGAYEGVLVLGPCHQPHPCPTELCKPGVLYEDTTWRPMLRHTYLRPYVEAPLFGRWTYPLGVTLYGLLHAGRTFGEDAYTAYVCSHVQQTVGIQPYALWDQKRWGFPGVNQQLCWLDALDDCGSFGSLMLECHPAAVQTQLQTIAERIGQYMLTEQPRTDEGAFCRRDSTIWADDMYMSVPFLCRYSQLTGNLAALDECAKQLLLYRKLLYMPQKHIMAHMMCLKHQKNNGIPWSRGNGWVIFSLSELLQVLPPAHPLHNELLDFFVTLTEGYLALQGDCGLWHQLLDEELTYPESSATAMMICAFCRGICLGWYTPAMARTTFAAALRAWDGLCRITIDRHGNLYGVCQGSGFSFSRAYYRSLMWRYNDTHGIGIVMLAGVELTQAKSIIDAGGPGDSAPGETEHGLS